MTLTARQNRILLNLALGDLLWEVPGQLYFTQYSEQNARALRVHINVLQSMAELGFIRFVQQHSHQLSYWSLTEKGQKWVEEQQPARKFPALSQDRMNPPSTKKLA